MQPQHTEAPIDVMAVEPVECLPRPDSAALLAHDDSAGTERFLILAHRLRRAKAKKPLRIVVVTSAISDEGKSTVAYNLACVLSRNGARTLLVDADLRMPDLHRMFGLRAAPGLGSVLSDAGSPETAIRRIEPGGLYFLPAGDRVKNPVPLLEGQEFTALLRRAADAFEWVIVDSPPLNPFADTQSIALRADAILLVVRWGFTPKDELNAALTTLEGLPLLGMIINAFDGRDDAYYHSYHARSGMLPAVPLPPVGIDERQLGD